jgi:tRNA pseudouridine65 synthase
MSLPILFQDQDLVIINKPSGLLVHRTSIDSQATEFAVQILRKQIGQMVYPVHRLDKATSGVLIFALSSSSAKILSEQFANASILKEYFAVVRGYAPEKVLVDHPLKEELDKKSDSKAQKEKAHQSAVTQVHKLAEFEISEKVDKFPTSRYSLVQCLPKTGRKHQIRRHLRHLGHPVIGDSTYGSGKHNRFFANHFHIRRLLLHCREMTVQHPQTNNKIVVQAELPEDMKNLFQKLNWSFQ